MGYQVRLTEQLGIGPQNRVEWCDSITGLQFTDFMENIESLAERLVAWRKTNGYSREQAALAIGVTASTVLRWESGKKPRGLSKQALARALNGK